MHNPLWDTNKPNYLCGEQLDNRLAWSASVLNDGAVTLHNRATGAIASQDIPSLADKSEWPVDVDLG